MNSFWLDVRFSWRSFLKRPAAAAAVVAILASAIATATVLGALFAAIVHDVPPIDAPDNVGHVWFVDEAMPSGHRSASVTDFLSWRDATQTLGDLTALAREQAILGDAAGVAVNVQFVTPAFFRLAGRSPRPGRPFTDADARGAGVAIISDRVWRERFDSDPAIVGRSIRLDAEPREIAGVMPGDFWFPSRGVDIWLPLALAGRTAVDIVGRLQSGRTWSDVQAEFDVVAQSRTLVRSLAQEGLIRLRPGLQGFVAPAILLLLIACANVGNLLVMRLIARRKEFAVRSALGAAPFRLARLSFVEASMLVAVAGASGLILATWAITALRVAVASAIPALAGAVRVDALVAAVAGFATIVTILGVAPWPALSAARADILSGLTGRMRRTLSARSQYGINDILVVVQVGLAVTLVLTSAFIVRLGDEIGHVSRPPAGDRVIVTQITAGKTLPAASRAGAFERLLDDARGEAGIESAALTTALPQLGGQQRSDVAVATPAGETICRAKVAYVTPAFFASLGLIFERGRIGSGPAAIVTESAASRCLGHDSDSDAHVRAAIDATRMTEWIPVTGVVSDPFASRISTTADAAAYVWIVGAHDWPARVFLMARTASAQAGPKGPALHVITGIATDAWTTFESRVWGDPGWFVVYVLGVVAALSLVLAFTGVYAAMSQSCAQRLVELGIRLALGADPRRLVTSAVARDAPLVVAGIVIGLVGTVCVTATVWHDLLLLNVLDARVWIGVSIVLAGAVLLATLGPALRAARVDPMAVLRSD
jgi:putative ABC transport system permease protein